VAEQKALSRKDQEVPCGKELFVSQ